MIDTERLARTIEDMVQPDRGILAADESIPTITKRFAALGIESTPETRRAWRTLLFTAPEIQKYLSGVILFEETLDQTDDQGTPLPDVLAQRGIVPGIKTDRGLRDMPEAEGEKVTAGLDDLAERLPAYRDKGARFTKWRDVFVVGHAKPSRVARHSNAEVLARQAVLAQHAGLVPIVEPEVLLDGDHSLEDCARATEHVLHAVFHALHFHGVLLEYCILKPSMVLPGKESGKTATPEEVAEATLRVFKRTVPAAIPSVNFLSGGQTAEQATANLDAMNRMRDRTVPWELSFSYARALQGEAMKIWAGKTENVEAAQRAFVRRARLVALARQGKYSPEMEKEA